MDFSLIDHPDAKPHTCALCKGIKGPFVSTCVDLVVEGYNEYFVFVCDTCAAEIATTAGHTHRETRATLDDNLTTLHERCEELERRLAEAENTKVVSLDELRGFVRDVELMASAPSGDQAA